jgi:hypothetical protein
MVAEAWELVRVAAKPKLGRAFRNPQFVLDRCSEAAAAFGISGLESIGKRDAAKVPEAMEEHFIDAVAQALQNSATDADYAKVIAKQLGCKRSKVKSAIYTLKRRGSLIPRDGLVSG